MFILFIHSIKINIINENHYLGQSRDFENCNDLRQFMVFSFYIITARQIIKMLILDWSNLILFIGLKK